MGQFRRHQRLTEWSSFIAEFDHVKVGPQEALIYLNPQLCMPPAACQGAFVIVVVD